MKALLASLFAALFAFAALSAHAATPLSASGMSAQPQSAPSADEDDKDKDKDGGKKPD
jgi:hypothetical protein